MEKGRVMLRLRKGHKHYPQRPFRCVLELRGP